MSTSELMQTIKTYGADTSGVMDRFMDDAELYGQCLERFVADKDFDALGEALRERDLERAFDAAHTLKGVAGNLGLTPLVSALSDVVEPLRRRDCRDLSREYQEVIRQRDRLAAIIK